MVHDYVYENDSFYNPSTLTTNFYLHHWEVVSASPAVPAVLFTTDTATSLTTVTQSVTGVNITAGDEPVVPGGEVTLTVSLIGTITENEVGAEVKPDAVTWEVSAATAASEGDPIQLNSRTYVDRHGVLHIQKSGLEAGNVLNVTGTTVYVNPNGDTTHYTKTVTLTVVDPA